MDEQYQKILQYLKENGRAPFTEIAEEVGVSEGTVRNRVKRMKEQGIIENFTINIGEENEISAFVSVDISTEREFNAVISDLPEGIEVYELAGDIDLLVKLSGKDSAEINQSVDSIRDVEGVKNTKTNMVLSKER